MNLVSSDVYFILQMCFSNKAVSCILTNWKLSLSFFGCPRTVTLVLTFINISIISSIEKKITLGLGPIKVILKHENGQNSKF